MKVLITPPGKEAEYPLFIRMIMLFPMAKYKRRRLRSKAIRRLKLVLLALYNLPKWMPDDFELTYDCRLSNDRVKKRTTICFGKDVRKNETFENSARLGIDTIPETITAFTTVQKQELYAAIRKSGFIHFETNSNIEVSYDSMVQVDYKLTCHGREYSYSWSTTEPTQQEWSEEESELEEFINGLARSL